MFADMGTKEYIHVACIQRAAMAETHGVNNIKTTNEVAMKTGVEPAAAHYSQVRHSTLRFLGTGHLWVMAPNFTTSCAPYWGY